MTENDRPVPPVPIPIPPPAGAAREPRENLPPAFRAGDGVATSSATAAIEVGGPKGPEPTRYGDWEHKGRCIDF